VQTPTTSSRATQVPPPDGPPSIASFVGEVCGAVQPLRLLANRARLADSPAVVDQVVMVFPGLGAGDSSTWPLRRWLRARGAQVHGWNLGVNRGDPAAVLDACIARAEFLAARSGRPVHLVGWSLGGVIAREIGRDRPAITASVVTFGTPNLGGPRFSRARRRYSNSQLEAIEETIADRRTRPISVPVTSIYSRHDGIVNWRSCVDRDTPRVRNVEVSSTHLGMGLDPDVWSLIAEAISSAAESK
jgi:Alpha/beta hydrolase family